MITAHRALLATIVASVGVLPLAAQDQPQPTLADLQGKTALSEQEQATLREWINARVTAVTSYDPMARDETSGSADAAKKAMEDLRTGHEGTDAFKEAYAATLIEAVRSGYKAAKLFPAARLITALDLLNDPDARGVLLEALKDQRVGVRTAAVVGLRNLRVKLALEGAPVFTETLNALRDAGKRETSSVTLKTIYQAMNYPAVVPSLPDAKANVAAVLDLLETRAQQYAARKVHAEGAEATGLKLAGALRSAMDDGERKRLTIAVAKMLKHAVTRYARGDSDHRPLIKVEKGASKQTIELRNQTELLIEEAEKLLSELASSKLEADKTIAYAMKTEGEAILMIIAMNKWADILKRDVNLEFYMDEAEEPTPPEVPPDDGG